ncbi:carboxymuconolactone decarboxylase family protein [Ensifer adhaerens]|uniref:carboxymuconolactone decarboxylase family protein n=1 Tax=Ensifer adhaerens TaxID=106592 RepID=UPI00384E5C3E
MARISLPAVEDLSAAEKVQFNRFPSNIARALLLTQNCTTGYLSLGLSLLHSRLNAKLRELVILRVAHLSDCCYELERHRPVAKRAGWTDEEIAAIEVGDSDKMSPTTTAVLTFVEMCVREVRVPDSVFEGLRNELGDAAVTELVVLIGFFMMTARVVKNLDIDLEPAIPRPERASTGETDPSKDARVIATLQF